MLGRELPRAGHDAPAGEVFGGLDAAAGGELAEEREEVGAAVGVGALEAVEALVRGARIWSSPSRSRPRAATGRGA